MADKPKPGSYRALIDQVTTGRIGSRQEPRERPAQQTTVSDHDHDPPENPTKAARALIAWFAGALAFECVHSYAEHGFVLATFGYGLGAVAVAIFDYKLPAILEGSPRLTRTLNQAAGDARLWIAVAMLSLLVIAISPYIEQRRLPFGWFQYSSTPIVIHEQPTAEDIVKAAGPFIDKKLASSKKEFDDLRDHFALLQRALDDMTKQKDAAEAEAQRLRGELGARVAQQIPAMTGPITWNLNGQFLVASGGGPSAMIHNIMLSGVSNAPVRIKEAYAISVLTGHRQELMANVQYQGYYSVDKVDIPANAPIFLTLVWQPPLSISSFLDQWGKFSVTVTYDDTTFSHDFTEQFIRDQLHQVFPDAFGPHVTPRNDK